MNGDNKTNRRPLNHPTDKDELNPAGSARRRMMRQMNGSAAAALTAIVATGWTKPIVESVILPAHAITSEDTNDGLLCTWGATLNMDHSGFHQGYRGIMFANGVSVAESFVSAPNNSLELITNGIHDPTSNAIIPFGYSYTFNPAPGLPVLGTLNISLRVDATCCDVTSDDHVTQFDFDAGSANEADANLDAVRIDGINFGGNCTVTETSA